MATKKNEKPAAAEGIASEVPWEEKPAAQAEQPVDAWDDYVDIVVPRKGKGEDPQFYVCVNDRRYMIPANGKMQKLPRPVAEILKESIEAEYEADDYADHIPNRSGETPQQHAII